MHFAQQQSLVTAPKRSLFPFGISRPHLFYPFSLFPSSMPIMAAHFQSHLLIQRWETHAIRGGVDKRGISDAPELHFILSTGLPENNF